MHDVGLDRRGARDYRIRLADVDEVRLGKRRVNHRVLRQK
jgi:hypothetical protein